LVVVLILGGIVGIPDGITVDGITVDGVGDGIRATLALVPIGAGDGAGTGVVANLIDFPID
jgi:hypothetical protein